MSASFESRDMNGRSSPKVDAPEILIVNGPSLAGTDVET